jgi:hypothetical protein
MPTWEWCVPLLEKPERRDAPMSKDFPIIWLSIDEDALQKTSKSSAQAGRRMYARP